MTTHLITRIGCRSGLLLFAMACLSLPAQAQAAPGPATMPMPAADGAGGNAPGAFGNTSPDPDQVRMMHKMFKERNALRQRTIVDDTNRLLDLAKQLKEAVDKSSKDQLSLDVVNTASEIEKLAKTVKDKMRDGD